MACRAAAQQRGSPRYRSPRHATRGRSTEPRRGRGGDNGRCGRSLWRRGIGTAGVTCGRRPGFDTRCALLNQRERPAGEGGWFRYALRATQPARATCGRRPGFDTRCALLNQRTHATQPSTTRRRRGRRRLKQRGAAPIGGNGRRHSSAGLGGITGTTCRTFVRPPQCIAVRLKLNGKLPRGTRIGQLPVQQFAASWQPREIDEDLHVHQFD